MLKYKIKFISDWHVGSGLDAGVEVDALVLKDEKNLPYLPGKTIKGLLKDAMEDMAEVGQCDPEIIHQIFGQMISPQERTSKPGAAFFYNATLSDTQYKELSKKYRGSFLYRNKASNAKKEKGIEQA
ncbi:MAG: RAMP superfamily CRISPR-associated protein, partial [Bacteroidota bacterium]